MAEKDYGALGQQILFESRNQLYMNMPYMDIALCALKFVSSEEKTSTLATDGFSLFYSGKYLCDRYLRGDIVMNRMYLHVVLHCMLRHLAKKQGRDPELWDLACDIAVESILDEMTYRSVAVPTQPARKKFYGECRRDMKVLTAEGIYRKLLSDERSDNEKNTLIRLFLCDDHSYWDPRGKDKTSSDDQDENWKNISEKTETSAETMLSTEAAGGEAILEQVKIETRDTVDYGNFLRRFAAPREIMEVDGDSFDFTYYHYGMSLYGNMPLIEPPETKEEKRIEELVIAIDTSMSTNGQLVREFLRCTYGILRQTETFTRKLHIHIMQCDDTLRSDTPIHSMEELENYMNEVSLSGGSATDFRPVFEETNRLIKEGVFKNLRGLIYFTDGMGRYPEKRPPYEAAFVMLEEPPLSMQIPPWCIRVMLDVPGLEKAAQSVEGWDDDEKDAMPEL